jgi:hypothetical protein
MQTMFKNVRAYPANWSSVLGLPATCEAIIDFDETSTPVVLRVMAMFSILKGAAPEYMGQIPGLFELLLLFQAAIDSNDERKYLMAKNMLDQMALNIAANAQKCILHRVQFDGARRNRGFRS